MIASRGRLRAKRRLTRMARKVQGPSHGRDFDREFWRRAGVSAIMEAAWRMDEDARGFRKTDRRKIPVEVNFRDLLSALNRRRARYLVVGAYAVMRYTEPRYTKDLDVCVDPAAENAQRVLKALADSGAPLKVWTAMDGVRFETAWENRQTSRIDGVRVHFIGLSDLMRNKKQTGRPQDLVDLANLQGET